MSAERQTETEFDYITELRERMALAEQTHRDAGSPPVDPGNCSCGGSCPDCSGGER